MNDDDLVEEHMDLIDQIDQYKPAYDALSRIMRVVQGPEDLMKLTPDEYRLLHLTMHIVLTGSGLEDLKETHRRFPHAGLEHMIRCMEIPELQRRPDMSVEFDDHPAH